MKICFLEAILHIYSSFLQEEQIFKSSNWGHPRDVYETQFVGCTGDQMMGRPRDASGTSVKHIFNFISQTH